jgi:lipoate-protein ligase A
MALDEALLLQAAESGLSTLRFYEWNQPTLSLGYFQRIAERTSHPSSLPCPVVRRTTGGGAILHDHELTYSCTLPAGHWLAKRAGDLYYAIHESIVAVLAQFGLIAHLQSCEQNELSFPAKGATGGCGAAQRVADAEDNREMAEPFLCFQRRTVGDIVMNGEKVAGSAQRRCRGAVLQHGSILLARSEFAPELPGIRDLGDCQLDTRDLVERLPATLSARLQFDFVSAHATRETLDRAAAIETSRFNAESWRQLR